MVLKQTTSKQLYKSANSKPPMVSLADMRPFLNEHFHIALNQLAKKYGNIFQIRMGSRNFVVLSGFETLIEALVKHQDNFNAKADFNVLKLKPQSQFLEAKSGERWKKHHKIFTQVMYAFLAGKSDLYESWVTEEAEKLIDVYLSYDGQNFEPSLDISIATSSFIQRLIFSKKGSVEDQDLVKVASSLRTIPNGLLNGIILDVIPNIWKPIFGFFHRNSIKTFVGALTTLDNYVLKNIEQHRNSLDPENLRNITDGLLKASDELTESEKNNFQLSESDVVKASLIQFVGAGTQLASYVLSWAVLYMIAYPHIQTEVQKELDGVMNNGQKLFFSKRSKLPFTEACINEILRHSSTTTMPAITYSTGKIDTTLGDYFISQNTPLLINYYGLTRDEQYWSEPELFNPYRFLDGNGKLRKDLLDKFYPFGVGSRRCIGEHLGRMQIFTLFINLMHRCNFEKVAGEKLNLKPELSGPTIFPHKYRVVVKSRLKDLDL